MISEKRTIVTCFIIALIAGFIGSLIFYKIQNENLITEYYNTENAVMVSPHGLRKEIARGADNFILVDLRSEEEYDQEHIIGAVNIPAYKNRDTSDYGAVDRIVGSFKDLKESNPSKEIIVYCYSTPCMTGRKVGKMLAEHEIYVKHLGIGWNEWKYQWTTWNHEHEWNITKAEDYIAKGNEAGTFKGNATKGCPIIGNLGC